MKTKKNSKLRLGVKVSIISLLILLICISSYAFMVYQSFTNAVETMHQPIKYQSENRSKEVTLSEKEPFSVLMLGVDEREGDKGRSDTMVVLTVNPKDESVKMLSIPRDTRTEIVGKGISDKINHAYAFGNEEMAMATVESFLNIPIDYYIKVNMEGFEDLVDAVGGISVNNQLTFSQDDYQFNKGVIQLETGKEALSFVRMRKEDPNGDFGRQERQRQIIQGVIKKGISLNSLKNYDDIFTALGKNVRTNLTFEQMKEIQRNYRNIINDFESLSISGEGRTINNIWYYIINDVEQKKISNELRSHLEI